MDFRRIGALTLLALSPGLSAHAQDSLYWGTISQWGGSVQLDPDNTDAETSDRMFGLRLGGGVDFANGWQGQLDVLTERSAGVGSDDDQTVQIGELALQFNASLGGMDYSGYVGAGRSRDNGDNDGRIPYRYAALGAEKTFDRLTVSGVVGALKSSDNFGESIRDAGFIGASLGYAVTPNARVGLSLYRLSGERWNDTTPNDNRMELSQATLSLAYDLESVPMTLWLDGDFADYEPEGESDTPWVNELRIGVTYHFGGMNRSRTAGTLPRLGRWVSISANEIE